MTAVVTGGAGFIGSHLCERLLAEGRRVICVDNLLTGREENIAHLASDPLFVLHRQDVTAPLEIAEPVEHVVHLAGAPTPADCLTRPLEIIEVGVLGTRAALELAKEKRSRFLLASAAEVYGDPEISPQPEHYWGRVNAIGPRGCYGETKRCEEAMTMAYHRYHGVNTGIARLFTTYGPRMRLDDGRAIPTFLSQALRGDPLTIHGDGTQTRSFCYVTDLIEGFVRLLYSELHDPVNFGHPTETSIVALARLALALTRSRSYIVYAAARQDDPARRCPDISKARQLLGWSAQVPLHEGLTLTHGWLAGRYAGDSPGARPLDASPVGGAA